ncbi:MAG: AarF/ABC1/UbiB kinase family protein [Rhodospirillaceae bacterium]|jgi:predicted unusual protein kinase regulating ubiquinone biosynthesis (AarF/ABC1/UbiB family)|nr:AarF/ABC1/UbiB kinase family protein [Rhodospirillaceae bacterium]MBT4488446.1 AarF/ABC1/UbiB kinase family protein [Rhodospirillaceae bacterium]MBT5194401.1 AarF/ABC1/UbiB kinase family protein [Rhodospirillaceae bacterium]MBT5894524.1 AarF/ABC1/UbiB kinase family protein [Rhodospirillaceae bacterium]
MSKDREGDSVGGRVRRYAKVGTAVGGLAARLAGDKVFGFSIDRPAHAKDLKIALGGLKGPLMKVAQILATIPEALPQEYVQELIQLQANAPAMGWLFVKRRMAAELGPDWQDHFDEFTHQAAAAASLGQVHRASLDGKDLACKLQYPDMNSAVEADLAQLKLIFSIYGRYDRTIDTSNVHKEISARLREELDYDREARHMALFAEILKAEKNIHIPAVVPELSTRRLLTMNWLDGKPLLDFREADLETRNTIALNMFRTWYVPFYNAGVIHGDPHLGNYTVRPDLDINLLDFGCVRVFDAKFVQGVIDLYRAIRDGDQDLAVHAYETWGFTDLKKEVIETLNLWAQFVYGPLLEDRSRRIREDNEAGVYGRDVAEKVHRGLRELGGVRPPQEFVFMDRAAIGLGGVFMHLNAEVNWYRHFHDLIDGFDAAKMRRKQAQLLKKFDLEAS